MARIPDQDIERLKHDISLQRLIEARGIELARHGADLLGLCPFHDDHSPSLVVSPNKNLWHCLGACQTGGSVIDWVMKSEGVSFRHAIELLASGQWSVTSGQQAVVKRSTTVKLPPPMDRQADDTALLHQVVGFYHETLKESPEALQYLEKRGLQSAEMIDRFRLGYANRTLGYRLPASNRQAGAEMRGRLQKLGVMRASGHEHFNGSLVIPILSPVGEVMQIYGRKIGEGLRDGTPLHLYLPGPHRGVWNEEALIASKEIILCESLIDALTFWCAGYRNVTASYGVNGFTNDHREALKRHGTERVYIAYDPDEAGDSAAAALAEELIASGVECFRVEFPRGQDANEFALQNQPADKPLGQRLNGAAWLGKGRGQTATVHAEPAGPQVEIDGDEVAMSLGARTYRVVGLQKCTSRGQMRVNVKVEGQNTRGEFCFHGDTLDMEVFRQRAVFVKQAAHELAAKEETIHREVGQLWSVLADLQREQIRKALAAPEEKPVMTEEERAAALELLRDPRLIERILEDFARCGVVGEEINKQVAYLGAVSRLLDKPLAIVVQSSSAAGKSSLMEAVLDFMPEEQREQYSAMTGQALYYMGQKDLKHKILAVAEEEGASRAAYALKLLQSEGALKIASTGKDPVTGKLVTHEYTVEGPVMIFLTTTAHDVDEELLNRSIVLTVNEDREQTRAIHRKQRESQTVEGLWAREERTALIRLHRNAQRLLRPIHVVNEQAGGQGFPDYMIRTRRDHMKFLTLVQAIALLHQHQRKIKTSTRRGKTLEYIEATAEDVKLACQLAGQVLTPSLDELQAQTRRLLMLIDRMVREECLRLGIERADYRFTRAMLRQYTRWGDTQLRVHLRRLEDLEYLAVRHGGPGQTFVYQLNFEMDSEGRPVLALHGYDGNRAGENGGCAAAARAGSGPVAGTARGAETRMNTGANGDFIQTLEKRSIGGSERLRPVVAVNGAAG